MAQLIKPCFVATYILVDLSFLYVTIQSLLATQASTILIVLFDDELMKLNLYCAPECKKEKNGLFRRVY